MPNTIPAAGEAMPKTDMYDMLDDIQNKLSEIKDLSEAVFMAAHGVDNRSIDQRMISDPIIPAINAYKEGIAKFSDLPDEGSDEMVHLWKEPWEVLLKWDRPCLSHDGAIAAIKLAIWEDGIGESQLSMPLMQAALAYLEARVGSGTESAMSMALGLNVNTVTGYGWAAIYDALSACITTAEGVSCQPRCFERDSYSAAGEYLSSLTDFLLGERRRVMRAAELAIHREARYRNELVQLVIRHHMDEMEFSSEDVAALEAALTLAKARGGVHA